MAQSKRYPPLKDPRTVGEERRRKHREDTTSRRSSRRDNSARATARNTARPASGHGAHAHTNQNNHTGLASRVHVRTPESVSDPVGVSSPTTVMSNSRRDNVGDKKKKSPRVQPTKENTRPSIPAPTQQGAPTLAPEKPRRENRAVHDAPVTPRKDTTPRHSTRFRDSDDHQKATTPVTVTYPQGDGSPNTPGGAPVQTRRNDESGRKENSTSSRGEIPRDEEDRDEDTRDEKVSGSKKSIMTPRKNVDDKKHPVPWWKIVINVWVLSLVVAFVVIGALGYVWWNQEGIEKQKNEAYTNGVNSVYAEPSVDTVIRNSEDELYQLLVSTPGNGFPNNVILTSYKVTGWSKPGGDEGHGRATLSICYTGDGVPAALQSYAYLVSDNANAQHPQWGVDTIDTTGEPCKQDKGVH